MALNKESKSIPYHLGRWFAVLEAIQQDAQSRYQLHHSGQIFFFRFIYSRRCFRLVDTAFSKASEQA